MSCSAHPGIVGNAVCSREAKLGGFAHTTVPKSFQNGIDSAPLTPPDGRPQREVPSPECRFRKENTCLPTPGCSRQRVQCEAKVRGGQAQSCGVVARGSHALASVMPCGAPSKNRALRAREQHSPETPRQRRLVFSRKFRVHTGLARVARGSSHTATLRHSCYPLHTPLWRLSLRPISPPAFPGAGVGVASGP